MPLLFATGPGSEIQRPLAIVVIGVGLTGVLAAFGSVTRNSADPVVHKQMIAVAQQLMAKLSTEQVFDADIVTELSLATTFFVAEQYHQGYFLHHPQQGYCQVIIAPKLAKFRGTP